MEADQDQDDKLVPVGTPAPTRNPNSPDHPDSGQPPSTTRKLIWGLVATLTVLVFGWWIYTLFFYDPGLLIDELEDRTFPTAAEPVCAEAVATINSLPRAEATDDPVERGGRTRHRQLRSGADGRRPEGPGTRAQLARVRSRG